MRDRALGSTIRLMFSTTNPDGGGAPVAPSSAFTAADIRIYKDGSATEKTSTNGITVTSPFDSVTGLHLVEIDTSNSTGDVGFWASGSVYQVRLVTAKTVATYSVSGLPIGEFSLEVQTADIRKAGGTAITQSGGRMEVNTTHFGGTAITATAGIPEVKVASMGANTLTAAAISADAGAELAALVETYIVNEGDATAVLQAIADKIAQDWIAGDASPIAIATAVWSVATRTITGGTLTTSPPTAAVIADAVWDEARSGHTTAGTYGEKVTAELDSATQTQITAIETFATRMTTGIVEDGLVWQFTANMLELGPSGSSTLTVLPATGIVADRSAGTTLNPAVGETISQAITVYQSDGTTAVDLSGKSLKVIFETMNGTDVAVVGTDDITISGTDDNVVTFAYPSAVTASERTLRFAIRDAAAPLTMYLQGVCSVVSAPKVDA